jgi:pyruvate ferredoxin oxidoreductase delta subunit
VTTELRPDEISQSRPAVGEAGRTGDWRGKRPVLVEAECLAVKAGKATCQICWVHCPDACVSRTVGPRFDLEYCKGCGICAEVCPSGAIVMVAEAEHGVCVLDEPIEVESSDDRAEP